MRLLKEIFKSSKKIQMELGSKNRVRDFLLQYVKEHPLERAGTVFVPNFWQKLSYVFSLPRLATAVSVLIVTLGTVTFAAAENSLPGDILHPLKIKINENVRSLLTVSTGAKAQWQIERANRRMVEIEKLADSGRLKAEVIQETGKRFEDNIRSARAVAGESGQEQVESALGALFLVHEDVLGDIRSEDKKVEIELKDLHRGVKEKLIATNENLERERQSKRDSKIEIKIESKEDNPERSEFPLAATEGKLQAAENKIAEVRKFLDSKKAAVNSDVLAEAERLLKSAEDSALEGKTAMNSGSNENAFALFQRAILTAQTSQRLVNVAESVPQVGSSGGLKLEEKIKTESGKTEIKIEIKPEEELKDDNSGKGSGDGEDGRDEIERRRDNSGKGSRD